MYINHIGVSLYPESLVVTSVKFFGFTLSAFILNLKKAVMGIPSNSHVYEQEVEREDGETYILGSTFISLFFRGLDC